MRPVCQQLVAIGSATIRGDLYDLGPYPGVILDGAAGRVRGQVVRVPSTDLWRRIDAYEACPQPGSTDGLFRRVRTIATLERGARDVECWVYVYNHPVRAERRVVGGCWLTHRQDPRI